MKIQSFSTLLWESCREIGLTVFTVPRLHPANIWWPKHRYGGSPLKKQEVKTIISIDYADNLALLDIRLPNFSISSKKRPVILISALCCQNRIYQLQPRRNLFEKPATTTNPSRNFFTSVATFIQWRETSKSAKARPGGVLDGQSTI